MKMFTGTVCRLGANIFEKQIFEIFGGISPNKR